MSTIITTTDLATYTGETLDSGRAAQVVDAVNEFLASSTGRSWGSATDATETYDYAPVIWLRHADVKAVTRVQFGRGNGQYDVSLDYFYFNESGRLVLNNGRPATGTARSYFDPQRDYVTVTYSYGTTSIPADLKLGALSLASEFYNFAENGNREIKLDMIGGYRQMYDNGKNAAAGQVIDSLLARYRTRHL